MKVITLSNRCSVAETVEMGERFDATFSAHRNSVMDTTALRRHEREGFVERCVKDGSYKL